MLSNIFANLPAPGDRADKESFLDLLTRPGLRIERIVSTGQQSPPGFWYDQPHDEWVIVLAGEAALMFENEDAARLMRAGDFLEIPAHRRHRVDWTAPDAPTVWLAIHYDQASVCETEKRQPGRIA